jgi:hypothetical protein
MTLSGKTLPRSWLVGAKSSSRGGTAIPTIPIGVTASLARRSASCANAKPSIGNAGTNCWVWITLDRDRHELEAIERELVREADPLLNRAHRVDRWPPAQLRPEVVNTRVQARWLWHLSWAAVLSKRSMSTLSWLRRRSRELVAEDGYPTDQPDRRLPRELRVPSLDELDRMFKHCALRAAQEVQTAVAETRRPVSTPEFDSGCRLAVKRFALGPSGRRFGDGGAEHPLGGGEVGQGARRRRDRDRAVLL